MMLKRLLNRMIIIGMVAVLSGCISSHQAINQPETIPGRVDKDIRDTEQARRIDRRVETPTATRSREIIKIPRGNDWLRDSVTFNYSQLPLRQVLKEILGKRPVLFQLIEDVSVAGGTIVPAQAVPLPGNAQFTPAQSNIIPVDASEKYLSMPVSSPMAAPTVMQHLESIQTQTGLRYSIENGVVVFADYELKVYSLGSTLVPKNHNRIFQNDTSGLGQGVDTDNDRGANLFSRTTAALSQMVTQPNVFITDSLTNTVSVAADPMTLRRVERYITALNTAQEKQVRVRIDVYDVNLSALGQRSIDFAIENLASDINALSGLTSSITTQANNLLDAPNQIRFGFDDPSKSLDGANALLRFLRQQDSVTTRQSSEFILGNNDTKTQVRTQVTPYVSKVSQTTNQVGLGNITTAPNIDTKEANTGTAIQLSASIVQDRVFLNMLLEESRLTALTPFSFGGSEGSDEGSVSGVLPSTEQVRSTHRLSLRDGETSAVGAQIFSQRQLNTRNGSLVPILGDSVDKNEQRIQTLIVVTANIF